MNTKAAKHSLPTLLMFVLLAGCVPAGGNDMDSLRAQVTQHDQILSQLNMQLSGVQPAQADTWSQVQSLRQEIASLRGEMDSINMAMGQSGGAAAMADLLARHERALRLIETQLAMDLQLDQPAVVSAAFGAPGAPGMTTPMPGVGVSPNGTAAAVTRPPVLAPASVDQGAQGAQNANPNGQGAAAASDTAQALYDAGMSAFNSRRYEQGLKAFSDFTEIYPRHNLVSNAWFWQGECHYMLKNYAASALAYERVIADFPNSNKAPDSYFKQGMSFLQLGRKEAAGERMNQLVQKYPRSPFATRAQQEIKNNGL